MRDTVASIYPPVNTGLRWPLLSVLTFALAVGGFYLVRYVRIQLALRAQKRLADLQKPNKDATLAKAFQEITRIQSAVTAGQLSVDAGTKELSLVVRSAFDAIMNHRTAYASRNEVGELHLTTVHTLLDQGYPVEFSPAPNTAAFPGVCQQAIEVLNTCR